MTDNKYKILVADDDAARTRLRRGGSEATSSFCFKQRAYAEKLALRAKID